MMLQLFATKIGFNGRVIVVAVVVVVAVDVIVVAVVATLSSKNLDATP